MSETPTGDQVADPGASTMPSGGSLWRKIFSNPWVGFLGSAASIVSFLLWFLPPANRDLRFHASPSRTTVFDPGQATRLKVSYDDRIVMSNVTAVQVAFWNKGSVPIKPGDVLKPIGIQLEGCRILEASVKSVTRDVVNARVVPEGGGANGLVSMLWDILEQGDGGIVQIIYEGSADAKISAVGVIEGKQEVTIKTQTSEKPKVPGSGGNYRFVLFASFFGMIGCALLIIRGERYDKKSKKWDRLKLIDYLTLAAVMALGGLVAWKYFTDNAGLPPFDF